MSATHAHGLAHRALFYERPEELLTVAEPFVREGIEREEGVCAIVAPVHAAALRDLLGHAAATVVFHAPADWYETPARTLAHYGHLAQRDGRLRVIGEPPFADRSSASLREWARADAILETAFAHAPIDVLCPYDVRVLPPEVLAYARRSHAMQCAGGELVPIPDADPLGLVHELADELDDPAGPVEEATFHEDPAPVRRFVVEHAQRAGVLGERLEALRLAVSELATNAILHGRAPRSVRLWRVEDRLVCEVEDGGAGIDSPFAGYLMPQPTSVDGRGLWVTRQLCDRVEVRGARVRVHVALS